MRIPFLLVILLCLSQVIRSGIGEGNISLAQSCIAEIFLCRYLLICFSGETGFEFYSCVQKSSDDRCRAVCTVLTRS